MSDPLAQEYNGSNENSGVAGLSLQTRFFCREQEQGGMAEFLQMPFLDLPARGCLYVQSRFQATKTITMMVHFVISTYILKLSS